LEKKDIKTKHEERRAVLEMKRKLEEKVHMLEMRQLRDSENMGE
jgi:hypothetical protein